MLCSRVRALKANARDAKTHSKKQIRQIPDSIAAFGFLVPILIDDSHVIIAGHGRYEDRELLVTELPELAELLAAEDLDISITDFAPVEINQTRPTSRTIRPIPLTPRSEVDRWRCAE